MANISAIKLPNGTTYTLKDNGALQLTGGTVAGPVIFGDSVSIDDLTAGDLVVNGGASFTNGIRATNYSGGQPTYTVIGTQTAATGSWTGKIDVPALYDGIRILYYLPYAGSGNATLNLTLSDGTTTGAINCYYNTGRLTTHYGAGQNFHLTYWSAGSISIAGTATTDDRWIVEAQYYSNTVSQLRHDYTTLYAGTAGIFPYTLIMMNKDGNYESIVTSSSTGTSKARNTAGFVPGRLALNYVNGTTTNGNKISASNYSIYEAYTGFDARYSFNISTTGLTVGKPVYLVGTITNGLFYLDTTWWTQTLPTTADGKVYMYVGQTYNIYSVASDYRVNIEPDHPMYVYTNGALRLYGGDASTVSGHTVAKDVPSNAVFTDNNTTYTFANGTNGFTVTPSGGSAQTVTVTPSIANNLTGTKTTATLTTTWTSNQQTVNVTGVTASNYVIVSPAPASYEAYCEAGIYCSAQASGTLTFKCDTAPTSSLTVNIMIVN